MLRPGHRHRDGLQLRSRGHRGECRDLPGHRRYNLATVYIVGRADVGEYGVAIVYSAMLIVVMMLVLLIIQLLVGERRIGRRAELQPIEAPGVALVQG